MILTSQLTSFLNSEKENRLYFMNFKSSAPKRTLLHFVKIFVTVMAISKPSLAAERHGIDIRLAASYPDFSGGIGSTVLIPLHGFTDGNNFYFTNPMFSGTNGTFESVKVPVAGGHACKLFDLGLRLCVSSHRSGSVYSMVAEKYFPHNQSRYVISFQMRIEGNACSVHITNSKVHDTISSGKIDYNHLESAGGRCSIT